MKLLVAGAKRTDAGKTTFAAGLIKATGAIGFKPRAGNDYWFDHDDCRQALADGRLYGKDAQRLANASTGSVKPETINPIHRLWRPAPRPGSGILGQTDREFILDRVGDQYVLNGTVEIPDRIQEALDLTDAIIVNSTKALNDATEAYHLPAQRDILTTIRSTDRAVIESYADVAHPVSDFEPDAVAVVEPRRVRLYRGDRYIKACKVAPRGQHDGTLEQKIDGVVDLLEPAATQSLDPLPKSIQADPDALTEVHGSAIEILLDLAADTAQV